MALNDALFPDEGPVRAFGLPPGVDFPSELVTGLAARLEGHPPEALARVELIVNTTRMRRRLRLLYAQRGAGFLPRIRLLTELGPPDPMPVQGKLARRLELAQLVRRLLDKDPTLAPRAAVFDLAESLRKLLDEVEGEGVRLETLKEIDVGQLSAHWARALTFINIIAPYLADTAQAGPEARQRTRIEALIATWQARPPRHPVIVAGSTGSRGTTALLMEAVASLPQGAVVLPGVDYDQPQHVWDALDTSLTGEDHPQFRFARLLGALGLAPPDLPRWTQTAPAAAARNRLVSLALRPAPVTDQWLSDGPALSDVPEACQNITLLEAPSARLEAQAIALCLRHAAETGKTAALVTPDRMLARQVIAALDRWRIEPDDSAGRPLNLTPPGRLLRAVAQTLGEAPRADALIALLKHPLTHSTPGTRGPHLLLTRDLELHLRRKNIAQPDTKMLRDWCARQKVVEAAAWGNWLAAWVSDVAAVAEGDMDSLQKSLVSMTERLARGPEGDGAGRLWDLAAGEASRAVMDDLSANADLGGAVTLPEYRALVDNLLSDAEVRDPARSHPRVMIWGTLEARVQGAELTILAGLNDGTWPSLPPADPWMNRTMRAQAGLLLPERQVGLSAHDFQQAIGAQEVVLSRAIRDDEAETVPSRWLNRLVNLLGGLSPESRSALAEMRARGTRLLDQAMRLDLPDALTAAAFRPAPCPPVSHRPGELSVTRIERLVRDPYAIYADKILRLRPLPLLGQAPDARDRGNLFHKVMEQFIRDVATGKKTLEPASLLDTARALMDSADAPPEVTAFWIAHLARVAEDIVAREAPRQSAAAQILTEQSGGRTTPDGLRLTCRADRLDMGKDGRLRIYDYKSTPPSEGQLKVFDFQLHLEAAIAEGGGIDTLGPQEVDALAYLSLSASKTDLEVPLDRGEATEIWDQFCALMNHWQQKTTGYTARRMMKQSGDISDYDHLSRYGEWEITDDPRPEDVG